MKPTGHRAPDVVRFRAPRFGLGRAVVAAPAMLGSLLLLTLGYVVVGRWAGLLLLAWVTGAAVLLTRVGEQLVLRAAWGFHRPNPAQAAALKAAWSEALGVTGTDAGDVELYVQTARVPNAYASGGRSVAVISRVVEDHASGRLPEDQVVAVLVHELGHHATGATRPMLLVAWLTTPWRLTTRLLANLSSRVAGCQSRRGALGALVVGLAVAVIRTARHGQWVAGGVLVFVAVAAVLVPLANAAISRRSEYAADRFAAEHGLALELAAALHALKGGAPEAPTSLRRMWATHPSADRRIAALLTAKDRSGGDGPAGGPYGKRSAVGASSRPPTVCQPVCQQASSIAVPPGSPPSTYPADLDL